VHPRSASTPAGPRGPGLSPMDRFAAAFYLNLNSGVGDGPGAGQAQEAGARAKRLGAVQGLVALLQQGLAHAARDAGVSVSVPGDEAHVVGVAGGGAPPSAAVVDVADCEAGHVLSLPPAYHPPVSLMADAFKAISR
jgi:hypothetical protein